MTKRKPGSTRIPHGLSLEDALAARVVTGQGCWEWPYAHTSAGYGIFRKDYMHRHSYRLHFGPIPAGLELDHLCRNRGCFNPDHLEAVTHAENMRRGYWGAKTHCPQGHEYTAENTIINSVDGGRMCRECKALRRNKTDQRRSKTHCVHGHIKEGNRNSSGQCTVCIRDRRKAKAA
jgi:hypothetical protein